ILVVISEMVGSTDGIGYFILDSQRRFRVPQMYAGMLALAILGYALNQIFYWGCRLLLPWHGGIKRAEGWSIGVVEYWEFAKPLLQHSTFKPCVSRRLPEVSVGLFPGANRHPSSGCCP